MKTRHALLCMILVSAAPDAALAQATRIEAEGGAAVLLNLARQDYERAKARTTYISVTPASTASALGKLCRAEIAIAGAARAMAKTERDACLQNRVQVLDLPLASEAVALVVNPNNTWATEIRLQELQRAWLDIPGKANSWKQLNAAWPDLPLKLYGPGPKMALGQTLNTALSSGRSTPASDLRRDIASTDVLSIVIEGVARDRLALGVLDWASYTDNAKRVRLLRVAEERGLTSKRSDGAVAFQLSLYINRKSLEAGDVKGYLQHLFANVDQLVRASGLAPLAPSVYLRVREGLSASR